MKKLLLAVALSLASTFSVAEDIKCDTLAAVIDTHVTFENKKPILGLEDSAGNRQFVIVVNPTAKTWTLFVTNGTKACVIESGVGVILYETKK